MQHSELILTLKNNGCRLTPQRQLIINLLLVHQNELMRVDDLLSEAKVQNPAINATTIYRNLEMLDAYDLIYTQNAKDGSKLYKLVCHTAHHHHIICRSCGQMLPIDYCPIVPQLEALVDTYGFTLEEHHLELYGLCAKCRIT